jgi:glutathione peroxidase-family protein
MKEFTIYDLRFANDDFELVALSGLSKQLVLIVNRTSEIVNHLQYFILKKLIRLNLGINFQVGISFYILI